LIALYHLDRPERRRNVVATLAVEAAAPEVGCRTPNPKL